MPTLKLNLTEFINLANAVLHGKCHWCHCWAKHVPGCPALETKASRWIARPKLVKATQQNTPKIKLPPEEGPSSLLGPNFQTLYRDALALLKNS